MSQELKDKKIEIFHDNGKINKSGDNEHEWVSLGKFWAYTRMLSMYEYKEYGLDTHNEERLFILNFHDNINPLDHIIYRDKEYSITSIDTYNDNKQDMKVYAQKIKPRRIGV